MDLFIPILTHVYGEAQLGGGLHRLHPPVEFRDGNSSVPVDRRRPRGQGGDPRTGTHFPTAPLPGRRLHHALLPQRVRRRPQVKRPLPLLPGHAG
ncbi:MAG: hypothetical protein MZU91_08035 [Desulfosudis oleivorans]|nr:hypothetical protein [Desulfosudis oleivorans]